MRAFLPSSCGVLRSFTGAALLAGDTTNRLSGSFMLSVFGLLRFGRALPLPQTAKPRSTRERKPTTNRTRRYALLETDFTGGHSHNVKQWSLALPKRQAEGTRG